MAKDVTQKFTSDDEEKVLILAGVAMHAMITQSIVDPAIVRKVSFNIAEAMVEESLKRVEKTKI